MKSPGRGPSRWLRLGAATACLTVLLAACQGESSKHDALTATLPSIIPDNPNSLPILGTEKQKAACEAIDYSQPGQGELTFRDEFDGTELNRDVWRARDDTYLDFDQALIERENVSVHDGMLDIMGRKLPKSQWQTKPKSRFDWNKVRNYSTGYVDGIKTAEYNNEASDQRFSQQYGYFEISAKVPSRATKSRGIWPAFWLRADDLLGEIDVMESYGGPTTRSYDPSDTYYWNSWEQTTQATSKEHLLREARIPGGEPIWKDFHRYGVNWSPTCLRYTFDGQTVGMVPLGSKDYFTGETFDGPFHIRLNMQIGSNYWGQADDQNTRSEFHYLVDYVRVYQGNEHQ